MLLQLKAQAGRDESVLRRSWRLLSSTAQLAISRAELDGVTYVGGRAVRQVKALQVVASCLDKLLCSRC